MPPTTKNGGIRKGRGKGKPKIGIAKGATRAETTREGIGNVTVKDKPKGKAAKGVTKGETTRKNGRGNAKAAKATGAAKDYRKLTVAKLHDEHIKRRLPKTGLKTVLIQRLEEADVQIEDSKFDPVEQA